VEIIQDALQKADTRKKYCTGVKNYGIEEECYKKPISSSSEFD